MTTKLLGNYDIHFSYCFSDWGNHGYIPKMPHRLMQPLKTNPLVLLSVVLLTSTSPCSDNRLVWHPYSQPSSLSPSINLAGCYKEFRCSSHDTDWGMLADALWCLLCPYRCTALSWSLSSITLTPQLPNTTSSSESQLSNNAFSYCVHLMKAKMWDIFMLETHINFVEIK